MGVGEQNRLAGSVAVVDERDSHGRSETEGTSLDQARLMHQSTYNGDAFTADTSDNAFSFRYTSTGDDDMTLRSSTFMGSILGTIQPQDEYVASWLTEGEGVVDVGRDQTPLILGVPAMFPTGRPFDFDFADYRQNLVHFRAGYLETIAAEHEGALPGPIYFDHTFVPDEAALRRWKQTITTVATTVMGTAPTPLLQSEVARLAATTLLDTFAHRTQGLEPVLLLPRNGRLREAVEYIHTHSRSPLTAADVAQAVNLTPRGLQQAFSRQLETTPTDYIRTVRLEHVHAELLHLEPAHATVSEIAHRWGFVHLSRFAASYVARYGEYPHETLRR